MPVAKKRCIFCKEYFQSESMVKLPIGMFCSYDHAKDYAIQKNDRKTKSIQRKKTAQDKENIKSLSDYRKEAQGAVNRYIRARDHGKPCISCGTTNNVQYAAGHYKTRGGSPELAFNLLNIHRQCNQYCNLRLSGNLLEYRKGLINRFGLWIVDYLESKHVPKKYTIDDLKRIKNIFNKRAKFYEDRRKRDILSTGLISSPL